VSRPRPHLRNLAISALAIALVLAFTNVRVPAPTFAQGLATLTPTTRSQSGNPGTTVTFDFTVTNNQTFQDTFAIDYSAPTLASGYVVIVTPSQSVVVNGNGGQANISIIVTIPSNRPAETNNIIVTADAGGSVTASAIAILTVTGPTTTPTNTPTTPTATTGPTETPGPTCPEKPDPGNKLEDAQRLLVDQSESHGICDIGDEDWFKFGAVGGKVYTIDIPNMDAGLDLSLELYDESGNRIAFNDDYFNRTPGQPNPKDIKPRIQSWRAPANGTYYIRVRDTLNIGGDDTTYTIIINSESYGPTPAQITEICRDLFEEDGLPEQAKLITSNEVQYAHVLCPTGDADWVKFFGLRGKTYYIYTDTRKYANNPDINNQTEAGADTVIYLADRDGVSIIDFNDDIQGSLDSELRFTPSADGFYYLQVKNVGDIGNQFIKYDLTLKLCVPGQECGRSPVALPQPAVSTPTIQATTVTTDTTGSAPRTTVGFLESSLKPGPLVNGPLHGFADPTFDRTWQRNDRPIAEQRASRSWTWGPHGLMARTEGYVQSASGLRQVQYFDKARMEVNNPRGDRNSQWFVTTGLLVVELITGRTQIGDSQFVQHDPANIPIAGDPDDAGAPTYASFGGVTGIQPGDRTGQLPAETIDRSGQVGAYAGPQRPETRMTHFVPESGHNIPEVFWNYLNSSGLVYDRGYRNGTLVNWVFTLGYPISDPYWTRIRVGGVERDVLVQAFQRRVLTYSPDNPSGWQVEMGNVGRHYYFWRYGEQLPD
jgi:hypothetical protein